MVRLRAASSRRWAATALRSGWTSLRISFRERREISFFNRPAKLGIDIETTEWDFQSNVSTIFCVYLAGATVRALFLRPMLRDIATVEYVLKPLSTFDPPKDFSEDPIVRALQDASLAGSKRFLARLDVCDGESRRIAWEVETDSGDAKTAILADIEIKAAAAGVSFRHLANVLALELHLDEPQAIVLALELTFPYSLVRAQMRIVDSRKRGVGKPRKLDALTNRLSLLAEAWERVTGRPAGTAERAYFLRALDAAKSFLPLHRRDRGDDDDHVIKEMRAFVRAEAKKIHSEDVQFVAPPSPLAKLTNPHA